MEPKIRGLRRIRTYLQNPETGGVKRHLLVDTTRFEGYSSDNNYSELTETMVFGTWEISTNPNELLQDRDDSNGMYKMHNDAINKLLARGYVKLKTEVIIDRVQFEHDFIIELMKRIFGVNHYWQLPEEQRQKLDLLESRVRKDNQIQLSVRYSIQNKLVKTEKP